MCGPFFGDQIATLTLDGRTARVSFEQAGVDRNGEPQLTPQASIPLT
jgi:hypothetical protein